MNNTLEETQKSVSVVVCSVDGIAVVAYPSADNDEYESVGDEVIVNTWNKYPTTTGGILR